MKYLFILLLVGCVQHSSAEELREAQTESYNRATRLSYFKDPRTNLCFAYGWGGSYQGGPILTNVPCTNEVNSLLKNAPGFSNW